MADHKKIATVYLIIVLLVAGIGMMSIRDLASKEESSQLVIAHGY